MAFKHIHERKGLSLTSFIDIIFLLLIFFMATINMSTVISDKNRGIYTQKKFDLPEIMNRKTGPVQEILQTLILQIEYEETNNPESPMMVFALWPSPADSVSLGRAKEIAVTQKRFAYFLPDEIRRANPDIPDISPDDFISQEIKRYADRYLRSDNPNNYIEVRAVKTTEYHTINHILNVCAEFNNRIPRIYIRTLSGEFGAYGI